MHLQKCQNLSQELSVTPSFGRAEPCAKAWWHPRIDSVLEQWRQPYRDGVLTKEEMERYWDEGYLREARPDPCRASRSRQTSHQQVLAIPGHLFY